MMSRPLSKGTRPLRHLPRPTLRPRTAPSPGTSIRHASSYPSAPRRFISTTLLLGGTAALVAYYYDSRSALHEHVAMPLIRMFADPETGHKLSVKLLAGPSWVRPRDRGVDGEELQAEIFGMKLNNPIGMAAGLDKDAEAIDGLFDLGFGYVEVGSVTPEPQAGNPKPRFFRLEEDDAAINRYGFNSHGHGHALAQLRARVLLFSQEHPELFPSPSSNTHTIPLPPTSLPRSLRPGHILAVNLGKNKTSPADSNEDYIKGVRLLGPYADVVVINVSSPNTPGLRALQGKEMLEKLLKDVVEERNRISGDTGLPKIAVKVACDLNEEELGDVAGAVRGSGVEGVIVSNTTIRREGLGLTSANQNQVGGLSGRPLFPLSLIALQTLRPLLPSSIPIIGCGGISSGEDALKMARAGASMVQLYTSFGYRGVGTPRLIKDEITNSLSVSSGAGASSTSTWKSQIGVEAGKYVGDEGRLQKTRDQLMQEAKGLGELLKDLAQKKDEGNGDRDRDEGTSSLIRMAEEALGKFRPAQPRDNLIGSSSSSQAQAQDERAERDHKRKEKETARGMVEDTLSPHVLEASAGPHTPQSRPQSQTRPQHQLKSGSGSGSEDTVTVTSGMVGSVPKILEDVLPPQAADLAPIVVEENRAPVPAPNEEKDEWTRGVKSGQRRLV